MIKRYNFLGMEQAKTLFNKFIVDKTDNTGIQFFRYIFVGGTAAAVDIGSLYVFTSVFDIHYLVSAALAFTLGIATNYFISIKWVFKSTGNLKKEVTLFVAIGVGGLILNELIMLGLVDGLNIFYMAAKLVSTAIVMIWNFGMRKKFVFND